jgi:hypothetical protein
VRSPELGKYVVANAAPDAWPNRGIKRSFDEGFEKKLTNDPLNVDAAPRPDFPVVISSSEISAPALSQGMWSPYAKHVIGRDWISTRQLKT